MTMILRDEIERDVAAREALLDATFGAERHEKTCERLREGRKAVAGLSFVVEADGQIIGTVRLWHVKIGQRPLLLLGPLAVAAAYRSFGIGSRLMRAALNRAAAQGHQAVILVGDAAYYERFGFSTSIVSELDLPGPVDRTRFLGLELQAGGLVGAQGLVEAEVDDGHVSEFHNCGFTLQPLQWAA